MLLFYLAASLIKLSSADEVTFIPLHPHPNVQDEHRRMHEYHGFKNSAVYDTIAMLRSAGERGERILTYYKDARFQQHEQRRREAQVTRIGQPKVPAKQRIIKEVFPLFQGLGSHYCEAHVGTPPQLTTLLVDTGSEMTGFPCRGCEGCGDHHTHPYFDPDKSSTFRVVDCNGCSGYGAQCSSAGDNRCIVGVSYLEGSDWKGYQSRDLFSLTTDGKTVQTDMQVPFTFACETSESGLFESQLENGIMGLMNADVVHLPSVLNKQRKIPLNSFALCMGWELSSSKDGVHSGIMSLGGYDDSHHTSPMVFVRNTESFGYNAVIRKIYLQRADCNETKLIEAAYQNVGDILIDSGTTLTYLSKEFEVGFNAAWKEITGNDYTNDKIQLNKNMVSQLPTVLIQLVGTDAQKKQCQSGDVNGLACTIDPENGQDVVVKVPPSHYMFYYGGNTYSAELHFESQYQSGGIIGGNSMQGHDVFFDNKNKLIGFAESSCDYGSAIARDHN